ncbi:hypothetical protein [uncultured Deinococcus sp.]|uniref:hypothetical protein n=1 Tax=uncultured Deinococcus sp. TaxID=158789 RepID=UPI0025CF15EF|nr:hypothetical protein [uncultured Deinococcus sp.]
MSSRPEDWTPRPGTAAHAVLAALTDEPTLLPRLPGVSAEERATSLYRLRQAGYVTRHPHPHGHRHTRWSRTGSGTAAAERGVADLTCPAARLLLILSDAPGTLRELHVRYVQQHPRCHRTWIQTQLQALEFADLVTATPRPAVWTLTDQGRAALPEARARLSLPPSDMGIPISLDPPSEGP